MKTIAFSRALPLLFVAITVAACAPTPTPVSVAATRAVATATVAIPPTTAPTATAVPPTALPSSSATPAPSAGKAFTFSGVQVTIPTAVANGANGQIVPAAQEQGAPEFAIHPAYTEIKLSGYPAQNAYFQGVIQVLPVADYQKISQTAKDRVQAMQALLAQKTATLGQEIPVLPVYNAAQVFRAQVQYLNLQNGAGVRFVTMYSQGLMPATNQDVLYTYQGLTADGAYWVSASLPVNAAFLPADQKSAGNPPAGGIAFPANPDAAQVKAYYQAVTDKLNATPAGQFTPSLAALDAMMQSLRVTAP